MSSFSRKVKNAIVGLIKDTVFEKSFYELKLKYDLAVMNNAGKNYTYDSETFNIISTLPQDANCIDVGCHKGDILTKIIEVASKGKHFAFEPIDELYDNLKIKFKNVNLHKIALSNVKGSTVFYNVITGQGVSGLKQREYDREHKTIEIKVETDLIDNIIPENLKIDFMKFDIEGGEYDAMRGGEKTIRRNKPIIVFEFEKGASDKYGSTPEMMYDFIVKDLGMKLSLQKYWLNYKRDFCFNQNEFVKQYESHENFYFIAFS
jgi:FkbM family methyltransferase